MWDYEYYIFDSNTITEKEFEEKKEYEGYTAFEDSMQGDEVTNKLNEQDKRINELENENKRLKEELFEAKKDYIVDTADISDKQYLDEMIEEERKGIYGDVE